MSGAQLAIGVGMVVGAGVWLLVRQLLPRHPDLVEVGIRMTSLRGSQGALSRDDSSDPNIDSSLGITERVGRRIAFRVMAIPGVRIPDRDLALLKISRQRFLGEKALMALLGLLLPMSSTVLAAVGIHLPLTIPILAGLVLAVLLWFVPDLVLADNARKARQEFAVNMTSFIELVALERTAAAGPVQALENAAAVGDSWVFHRIHEELERSHWAGQTAWAALRNVGDELRIPELTKIGDVMRVSGEEGGSVYDNLRSLARSLRNRLVTSEQESSGARTERSYAPLAASMIVFVVIVITPMAMQIV